MDSSNLLEKVVDIAREASDAIMEIYESDDFEVELKEDDSPLTKADRAAHEIIEEGLQKIAEYPVVSEEGNHNINGAKKFWLVDPVDGTKEFIKKNGEFTVNIALIENEEPILGVVSVPAKNVLYAGEKSQGAYKIDENGNKDEISAQFKGKVPKIVASRSHRDSRVDKLLEAIGEHEEVSMGSSLKLCLVAEGEAQIYPRLAPTCLWDTAAADAVVRSAGGKVRGLDGNALKYRPAENIKNPFFVVTSANDTIFESNRHILKDI
jgi:3'(2'), 5'-bisphosphate nucleotidase